MTGPWITPADLPAGRPALPGGEEEWAALIDTASRVLWALSGRRWSGVTTRTVAVAAPAAGSDFPPGWHSTWGPVHPELRDGEVINCTCAQGAVLIRLPSDAVQEVTEVRIGGTVRAPATYTLSGSYLLDLTGRGWPTCPPGFSVTYRAGKEPPPAGREAAVILTAELGRSRIGDPAGLLPGTVKSRTRQAVTETFLTAADLIAQGQVGIPAVDHWLATVNPHRLTRRARAWSPDTHPRTYRRTTP